MKVFNRRKKNKKLSLHIKMMSKLTKQRSFLHQVNINSIMNYNNRRNKTMSKSYKVKSIAIVVKMKKPNALRETWSLHKSSRRSIPAHSVVIRSKFQNRGNSARWRCAVQYQWKTRRIVRNRKLQKLFTDSGKHTSWK